MPRVAVAVLFCLLLAGCANGGGSGALSIEQAAERYESGDEAMTVRGAVVIDYGEPMLCSGVDPQAGPGSVCRSPAFHLAISPAGLERLAMESNGSASWAESATLRGTLDEGVFIVTE